MEKNLVIVNAKQRRKNKKHDKNRLKKQKRRDLAGMVAAKAGLADEASKETAYVGGEFRRI
jgi:hypothetical protein